MNTVRKGADYENLVRRSYEERGWHAHRCSNSLGEFDVCAIHSQLKQIKLIQCKNGKSYSQKFKENLKLKLSAQFNGVYDVVCEVV